MNMKDILGNESLLAKAWKKVPSKRTPKNEST